MSSAARIDVMSGMVFVYMAGCGLFLMAAVILIEAVVLRIMRWGPLGRCLLDSLLMNLVSSAAGVALAFLITVDVRADSGWGFAVWVLVTFVLSLFLEAGTLRVVRRIPFQQSRGPVLTANVVSYLAILVPILVAVAVQ